MENIGKLFEQEVREKKRVGSNIFSRVSTRKGGSSQALRTPYLYMSRKEKKQLNGEVMVVYNMNDIMKYNDFKKKSSKEQRELMLYWRDHYKASEIQNGMGISRTIFYRILDQLDVPKETTKGLRAPSMTLTDEQIEQYTDNLIDYDTFRKLSMGQKMPLFESYLRKYKAVAELSRNWTGSDMSYLYSLNGRLNKRKSQEEKTNIATIAIEPAKQEESTIPESTKIVNENHLEAVSSTIYDSNELNSETESVDSPILRDKDGHGSEIEIHANSFSFELKGSYTAQTIIRRLKLALEVLEDEEELLNLEIKISNNN